MSNWFDRTFVAFLALLAAALVALIGYAIWYEVNDPGQGTVTGKDYSSTHTTCSGKPLICTTTPECYRITYTDGHHDGDACVDPETFARFRVGDHYPDEPTGYAR
jgi:hypothetical protein